MEEYDLKGEKIIMKKILLVVVAMFMLTSCGGNKNAEDSKAGQMGDRGFTEKSFNTESGAQNGKTVISEEDADFGNFVWGMPKDEVTATQGPGYYNIDNDTIRYDRIRIDDFASDAEYTFTDEKLSQAIYFIKPDSEYENKEQYLDDYKLLVEKYTKRYGAPSIEEIQFAEGKETEDSKEQADLLNKGMILFRTAWQTETTDIRVNMAKNEQNEIVIGMRCVPIEQAE